MNTDILNIMSIVYSQEVECSGLLWQGLQFGVEEAPDQDCRGSASKMQSQILGQKGAQTPFRTLSTLP